MPQHCRGRPAAQHVDIVDELSSSAHAMHDRQRLTTRPEPTGPIPEIDSAVEEVLEPETLRERPGQQQSGVGDCVGVIEGHSDPVQTARDSHREDALLIGEDGWRREPPSSQFRGHFPRTQPHSPQQPNGGFRLREPTLESTSILTSGGR